MPIISLRAASYIRNRCENHFVDRFLCLRCVFQTAALLLHPFPENTRRGERCYYLQLKVDHGALYVNNIKSIRYERERKSMIRNIPVIRPKALFEQLCFQNRG